MMENAEEIFQSLDDFAKRKPKLIPRELEDYLAYVARTGDPVYQWSLVKCLFKEKLLNVITDFYETSPGLDIPHCPNVDPFNYDTMKNSLLEKIDSFSAAPFTVQRICELLTAPRKQYNRIDKFMRAIEKNVLVVSTREPGVVRHIEQENGDQNEPIVNGSDNNSDYNVDVEMEDVSWKENLEAQHSAQPQPSSSEGHISVDDIEARLQAKEERDAEQQEKTAPTQYESVTPPELNVATDENMSPNKPDEDKTATSSESPMIEDKEKDKTELINLPDPPSSPQQTIDEDKTESNDAITPATIPEIRIDDAEMTEQKLIDKAAAEQATKTDESNEKLITEENTDIDNKNKELEDFEKESQSVIPLKENMSSAVEVTTIETDKDVSSAIKNIPEAITSSEESSSSSDNTDGNSNSPKTDNETNIRAREEPIQSEMSSERETNAIELVHTPAEANSVDPTNDIKVENFIPQIILKSDDYSITDVKSELIHASPEKSKEIKVNEDEEKEKENPMETEINSEVNLKPKDEVTKEEKTALEES